MSDFTEESLNSKISHLTHQMESIQGLSHYFMKHHKNREIIIRTWLRHLRKESKPAKIVNLLYLANDVAQNTRKTCPQFKEDFFPALESSFRHLVKMKSADVDTAIGKLVKVWKDREIYTNHQIKKLNDIMSEKKMSGSFPTPAINDPVKNPTQNRQFIEEEVKKNAQDVLMALNRLQNPPSTEREIRVVLSQYPESISCPEKLQNVRNSTEAQRLLKQNQEALPLLEDYVKRLKDETRERESLQNHWDHLIQNVRYCVEHQEKLLKEVKRKEDRLKSELLEVERSFESLPDLTAEMPAVESALPTLDKLFSL